MPCEAIEGEAIHLEVHLPKLLSWRLNPQSAFRNLLSEVPIVDSVEIDGIMIDDGENGKIVSLEIFGCRRLHLTPQILMGLSLVCSMSDRSVHIASIS